jgi:integrase
VASYEKLPSGKWRAVVYHPSGKKVTKTDPLKSVVRQWATETEASIHRGDYVDPRLGKLTVAKWYAECVKNRAVEVATAKKAQSSWNAHVEPKWGSWPLSSIQYEDCRAWIGELGEKKKRGNPDAKAVGADTVAIAGRLLRFLLDEAVKAKRIPGNPMRLVKLPSPDKHVDRIILRVEELRMYTACASLAERTGHEYWLEVEVFLRTLFGTGLRFQEAAGLTRADVNPLKRIVTVRQVLPRDTRELRRKGKTPTAIDRTVPITSILAKQLEEQLARHGEHLVFVTAVDRLPMHYSNFRSRHWQKILKEANLADPQPTIHDIRHTYGSRLADRGVLPHEIKESMGHARLSSTERYLHPGEERLDRTRRALDEDQDFPPTSHGPEVGERRGDAAGL